MKCECKLTRHTANTKNIRMNLNILISKMLWECHVCVLIFVTQQVSESVMAVVPGGYCLSKPRLKGSVFTAENVERLNGEI